SAFSRAIVSRSRPLSTKHFDENPNVETTACPIEAVRREALVDGAENTALPLLSSVFTSSKPRRSSIARSSAIGMRLAVPTLMPRSSRTQGTGSPDRPEVDARRVDLLRAIGRPAVAHGESVRHDARAGTQFGLQARHQLLVEALQEVERDDGGLPDLDRRIEDVAADERDAVCNTGLAHLFGGFLDALRIDVDADRARAEPGRSNQQRPVAAPEVVHHVVGR